MHGCICTCKQSEESGGNPVQQPSLQRKKQLGVLGMSLPFVGDRKAEKLETKRNFVTFFEDKSKGLILCL